MPQITSLYGFLISFPNLCRRNKGREQIEVAGLGLVQTGEQAIHGLKNMICRDAQSRVPVLGMGTVDVPIPVTLRLSAHTCLTISYITASEAVPSNEEIASLRSQ